MIPQASRVRPRNPRGRMAANGTSRKVTSVDVARLAGVNQSTVSRTFSGDANVRPATRERVLAAAATLGYTPNAIARSLITRRTNIVGMVTASTTSPFQPYVLEKFTLRLRETGRQVLIFSAALHQEVDDILPTALQYQVDALIITSVTLSSARIDTCVRAGTPVILFNRYMPGERIGAICCDNRAGAAQVADFLLDAGHVRPAYMAGPRNSSTNRDREMGFAERLQARGVAVIAEDGHQYTYEAGYEAARRLFARPDPPDAIFCASDILALGTLDCAREHGIAVPDALSVVGFDDIPMARWSAYSLTTIRQPVGTMIDATIGLLDRLDATEEAPTVTLFPGTLVARGSARRPPNTPG
jgi:DNA-binding LacI/PurR family transcriptional regulator